MGQTDSLRRTPLYEIHRDLGGRLVPFAGWEMPVQYSGVVSEHLAVRNAAGLFDVSHMGEVEVRGERAGEVLQRLTCNDVASLRDGEAQYSAMLNPEGGVLDDLIVYRRRRDSFLVIVNAGNRTADFAWMQEHAGSDAQLEDRSDDYALLALQGPRAVAILQELTHADISSLAPFQFTEGKLAGSDALMARTGYTGEDGFEILTAAGHAASIWQALSEHGKSAGMLPVGLGARDTLRLEAGLLLHGQDMSPETTPLEAGIGFIVKLEEGDFIGRDALLDQRARGLKQRLRGMEMMEPGIARHGHPVWIDGEARGEVTSGSFAPFLKKNIARAYLPTGQDELGHEVEVEVRRRKLRAKVVKMPFYRRPRR